MQSKFKNFSTLIFAILLIAFSIDASAVDRRGRLGVGFTNQLKVDIPAISFKLQRSKSFSLSGLLAYSTSDTDGGHGAGLKVFRNLFEEPQLVFYVSALGALISKKTTAGDQSGFQADITLGSEFSFQGLQSIGFSFEFGGSFYKLQEFSATTTGNSFIVSAIHFYL
ncbi:MAG: hypothetical protein GY909_03035 [Oligoflexia bacterium]|nr:hypothetical protein [Oligoflexia bacterium]